MKTMRIWYLLIPALLIMLVSCEKKENQQKVYNKGINLIPTPLEMTVDTSGKFTIDKSTVFVVNCDSTKKIAEFFAQKINKSTGYNIKIADNSSKNAIKLSIDPSLQLKSEGYKFVSTEKGVEIVGRSAAGVFYGMQTLLQLLPAEIESSTLVENVDWNIPYINITDEPRFAYRGVHFDPSRHFVDVEFVKKQIDIMASLKINTLHWHLTDDQGWRIEIKKYPELSKAGATRTEGEGFEYGPLFYTQDEAREIVAYAAERFITVIPELEVPGHELAAISAYPWLSCTGDSVKPRIIWGVEDILMCPGKETTFEFLQNVIDEMVEIFPSEYFHIGGDECPKAYWKECPLCQAKIKAENLDSDKNHSPEERLQSYVVGRVEEMLAKHGRKIIGWDEILEGKVRETATIMSWRGEEGGIVAAMSGHDVIMTPSSAGMYIDHYQGDYKIEPVGIGGYSTLEKVYSYNPVPDTLKALGLEKHILGVQCNLWAEYLYTTEVREYRYYPRVHALAEIAWSELENKSFEDFNRRINNAYVRLDMQEVNYHIPQPEQPFGSCNFVAFVDSAVLEFTTSRPIKVVYSLDGSELTENSAEYTVPIVVKETSLLKIASILPSGKTSPVREIKVEKQSYSPAENIEAEMLKPGLKMHNVAGMYLNMSEFEKAENMPERDTIISKMIDIRSVKNFGEAENKYNYASFAEGYIEIPEDGIYYFSTDNEEFWIDGKKIIDNVDEVKRFSRHDHSVALAKGLHKIKVVFLKHIIGGWPSVWNDGRVEMRRSDMEKFENIDGKIFYKAE